MLYSFAELKKKHGSPYQIEKAIRMRLLFKMSAGVYSDSGKENDLEILQWCYPRTALTLGSAYFYNDLTDDIPDVYYLATDRKARAIKHPLVKQIYLPEGTFEIGLTEMDYCGMKIRTYDLERLLIENVRMKRKLPPDLYKEVTLAFREKKDRLSPVKIAEYLQYFPKRDAIETIIYEEVF